MNICSYAWMALLYQQALESTTPVRCVERVQAYTVDAVSMYYRISDVVEIHTVEASH